MPTRRRPVPTATTAWGSGDWTTAPTSGRRSLSWGPTPSGPTPWTGSQGQGWDPSGWSATRSTSGPTPTAVHSVHADGSVEQVAGWQDAIHVRCVTGSGTLVGEIRTDGAGGNGEALTSTGTSIVAVRPPAATEWTAYDDVEFTHQQDLGCTDDAMVIVGETDVSPPRPSGGSSAWTGGSVDALLCPASSPSPRSPTSPSPRSSLRATSHWWATGVGASGSSVTSVTSRSMTTAAVRATRYESHTSAGRARS